MTGYRRVAAALLSIVLSVAAGPVGADTAAEIAMARLVGQIVSDIDARQKRKIAVLPFVRLDGSADDLGRYLSEQLVTELFKTKRFEILERAQLERLISEQKLALSDLADPSQASKLGQLNIADLLVTGSVVHRSGAITVNARLVETQTSQLFAAASASFPLTADLASLVVPPAARSKPEGAIIAAPKSAEQGETAWVPSLSITSKGRPVPGTTGASAYDSALLSATVGALSEWVRFVYGVTVDGVTKTQSGKVASQVIEYTAEAKISADIRVRHSEFIGNAGRDVQSELLLATLTPKRTSPHSFVVRNEVLIAPDIDQVSARNVLRELAEHGFSVTPRLLREGIMQVVLQGRLPSGVDAEEVKRRLGK